MPDSRTPRPMTPADIRRQVVVEELDLAPDGATAVVVRRSIRGNKYLGHLLAIPLEAGRAIAAPRTLTTGSVRDTKPRISPDGTTVAFVRSLPKDDERPSRVMLMPLAGGTARALRRGDHGGIGEIAWSPDGQRIAFTSEVDPPRFIVGPTAKLGRTDKDSPRARHIRRTDWRWDEEGHLDRWAHLWIVDAVAGATPRRVTSGDWGVSTSRGIRTAGPSRSPRTAARSRTSCHERPSGRSMSTGPAPSRARSWRPAAGRSTPATPRTAGGWSPSGVVEALPLDFISPTILLAPADGSRAAEPIDLAPDLDRAIGNWVDTDLNGWMVSGRHGPWFLDDATILATVSDHARSHPRRFRFDPATGAPIDPPLPIPTSEIAAWPATSTHTLAVAPATGAIVSLATRRCAGDGSRIDRPRRRRRRHAALHDPFPHRRRVAAAVRAGRAPQHVRAGAWRPDRDVDRDPRRRAGRADAHDRRRPRRPARCLGAGARTSRSSCWPRAGYRVVLPNIRGRRDVRPRLDPAAARRLGRGRRRRRPRCGRSRHRARPRRPGAPRASSG